MRSILMCARQLPQKFKVGRNVWLKTDTDGSYRMTVTDVKYDEISKIWLYELKDSMNMPHDQWVPEKQLKAAGNPRSGQ